MGYAHALGIIVFTVVLAGSLAAGAAALPSDKDAAVALKVILYLLSACFFVAAAVFVVYVVVKGPRVRDTDSDTDSELVAATTPREHVAYWAARAKQTARHLPRLEGYSGLWAAIKKGKAPEEDAIGHEQPDIEEESTVTVQHPARQGLEQRAGSAGREGL